MTAYCQTTGIGKVEGLSREQKLEIVSTLKDYPLVKQELQRVTDLLQTSNTQNALLRTTIDQLKMGIADLELKNSITEKQLRIREEELEAAGTTFGEKVTYITGGFTVGAIVILILKIL